MRLARVRGKLPQVQLSSFFPGSGQESSTFSMSSFHCQAVQSNPFSPLSAGCRALLNLFFLLRYENTFWLLLKLCRVAIYSLSKGLDSIVFAVDLCHLTIAALAEKYYIIIIIIKMFCLPFLQWHLYDFFQSVFCEIVFTFLPCKHSS